MTVGESICHLADVTSGQWLLKPPLGLLLQALVEFSLGSKLQYEINSTLVIEISKQSKNVGVSQMGLDLYFSPEIFHIFKTIQNPYWLYLSWCST